MSTIVDTETKSSYSQAEKEYREKLLRMVKKEVKQIMEEAVTRKFVHEESSSITSLCAAVDACLSHGLKRRALGLFKTNSTTALLQKVAKYFEPAAAVLQLVVQSENSDSNKRNSSSSDSTNQIKNKLIHNPVKTIKYLWIRVALFEKHLVEIIDHVVANANNYYEKEALVADPVCGQILASLLVGPCALDYSKMKTSDHYWTDPPADELVQRNRMLTHNNCPSPPVGRKPLGLPFKKNAASDNRVTSTSEDGRISLSWSPKDYVESLHQNCKSTLLYGKNNVLIQPSDNLEAMAGYLSLHQTHNGLVIKWTPNQLMNSGSSLPESSKDKSIYWDYAMSLYVEDIVYLHCHQHENGGTAVLVGQDGVQRPPIRFPKGGHLLAFLTCLENGLMPYGQLDPPLWSDEGKGKVFPRLKRKYNRSKDNQSSDEKNECMDYVFRIIVSSEKPDTISQEMFDPKSTRTGSYFWLAKNGLKHNSSTSSSTLSSKSLSEDSSSLEDNRDKQHIIQLRADRSIQILCDTMKRQIISRAFYGWLAHCRHLRTVRTHLSGLVNPNIIPSDKPSDASKGLTQDYWKSFHTDDGRIKESDEIKRLIYYGGCEHSIRNEVWPYLLGHYSFDFTKEECRKHDEEVSTHYEITMTEWLAVEAIVRQRDKETMAANLAKLSSESNNSAEIPLIDPKEQLVNTNNKTHAFFDQETKNSVVNDVFLSASSEEDEDKDNKLIDKNDIIDSKNNFRKEFFEENISDDKEDEKRPSSGLRECLKRQKQITNEIDAIQNILITNPSIDTKKIDKTIDETMDKYQDGEEPSKILDGQLGLEIGSNCISPASSNGGVYSNDLLDSFSLNLHRIDKDVQRCDRNFWYFMNKDNLEKLRNVMCTYVWEHLDQGYVQGMCDLVAPFLVIFDEEVLSYSCFCELMKRMATNFPQGGGMDAYFANMRSLIQILDNEIFDLMHQNGDYTHFYFCYRWFLLDFKRELLYEDVFRVWEAIWAAKYVASSNFVLFIALALVQYYRDVILENNMDFVEIIKFFNEMAERHDAKAVLKISRDLVLQIQTLIDNK